MAVSLKKGQKVSLTKKQSWAVPFGSRPGLGYKQI